MQSTHAEKVGLDTATISRLETDVQTPPVDRLSEIANALATSLPALQCAQHWRAQARVGVTCAGRYKETERETRGVLESCYVGDVTQRVRCLPSIRLLSPCHFLGIIQA